MKDQILNLLKSPDKTNQELALTIAESNNINIDEEFWNPLQEIYRLNHKSNGNKEELLMLFNETYLDLSNLKLNSLPESIGNLSNLQNLYLYDNQLTSLPESIGNLKNVKWLHLYNNQLTEFEQLKIKSLLPLTKIRF